MPAVLGFDLGTGSLRGVAVTPDGRVLAVAERQYPLATPQPGWSEQTPLHWWVAATAVIRELLAALDGEELLGIACSGQMHGLVALDERHEVIRDAILWNDQRTGREVADLHDAVGAGTLISRTGNPAITGFQLPKILWLRRHEPEAFARLRHALLPKDWLTFMLTGELVTEPSDASGSGCMRITGDGTGGVAFEWDESVLDAVDLDRGRFPRIMPSTAQVGKVAANAALTTGLPAGLPVFAGAGDNAAANTGLGLGSHRPERGSLSLGTSGVLFAPLAGFAPDPRGRVHLFAHADGRLCLLGVTLAAGGSLRWFRSAIMPTAPYERIAALAATSPPGALGVTFHPYLAGERSPLLDPDVRGSFTGLSLAVGTAELARAVLEGVAFSLRDTLAVMRERLAPAEATANRAPGQLAAEAPVAGTEARGVLTELLALGGGARSDEWLQICADVLGVRIIRPANDHGAAYGAALLALAGLGLAAEAAAEPEATATFEPGGGGVDPALYEEAWQRYRAGRSME